MAFSDIVNQQVELIIAGMAEKHPDFDIREGTPLYDFLISPFRDLVGQVVDYTERRLIATKLQNADQMTDAEWDAHSAIHFMPRLAGNKSSGTVRAYFSRRKDVTIDVATTIMIGGKAYAPLRSTSITADQMTSVIASPASASKPTNNLKATIVSLQSSSLFPIKEGTYNLSVNRASNDGYLFTYHQGTTAIDTWTGGNLVQVSGGEGAGILVLVLGDNPPVDLPVQDFVYLKEAKIIYGMDVDVQASADGSDYSAEAGTAAEVGAFKPGVEDFVSAETVTVITGGVNRQSNKDNLKDIQEGIGVRNLINDRSIRAVLPRQFRQAMDLTIVGYQETEMRRDRIRVRELVKDAQGVEKEIDLTLARGSMADIYAKTPLVRRTVNFVVNSDAEVDLSEYNAVLKVHGVTVPTAPGQHVFYLRSSEDPTLYLSARDKVKLLVDPALVGRTVQVDMTIAPDILEMQRWVDSDNVRVLLGDLLIRAHVPVWVTGLIYVAGAGGRKDVIKKAINDHILSLQPGDALSLSSITAIIERVGVGYVVQNFDLTAEIRYADGTIEEITRETIIELPDDPSHHAKVFTPRIARWLAEAIEIIDPNAD